MSSSTPVVGIDLGTTYSCIAYYDGSRQVIIQDNNGDRIIQSMVFFDPENGKVFVGEEAYRKSVKCPMNLIKDSKRLIGRTYNDTFVLEYMEVMKNTLKVVRGENDMAAFSVRIGGQEVIKLPEEVSAEILRYLMEMADKYFRRKVTKAVISVPAYFSNSQRKATEKAAQLVGLEVMKLITEPTAGAVHYLKDKNCVSNVMVFDWGGGTLDISFIEVKKDVFNVKAVYGDSLLGGRDIDEKLFGFFNIKVSRHADKFDRKLLRACVRLKKRLSDSDAAEEVVPGEEDDIDLVMTRKEFDDLLKDIFCRIADLVQHALRDSGWSASEIDQLVLVGGSSRIAKVQEILQEVFGSDKLKSDLNPDEAVAAGASIQAFLLENGSSSMENWEITEVTPLSLGTATGGGLFEILIKRNTKLPVTKKCTFVTCANNQSSMRTLIYEGERKNCKYNNKLGEFDIDGLPEGRAGDIIVTDTFNLNKDGILTVTSTEESTGIANSLTVTMGEFRLNERKINYSLAEAEKEKFEDDTFENFTNRSLELQERCYHILYDLEKIDKESDREIVDKACKEFLKFEKNLNFIEIDQLEARFKIMYEKRMLIRTSFLEARYKIMYEKISHILKENNMEVWECSDEDEYS